MFIAISIATYLILFFVSLLFAGMKGRERAKIKLAWSLAITFIVYVIAVFIISKNDSFDTRVLGGGSLIFIGAVAGFALNKIGQLCIDFVAIFVMPDNRDKPEKN